MFYRKNLPTWERVVRVLAAISIGVCAWHFRSGPGGIFFGISAVVTGLTAVLGICPMCAMAGRRLDARSKTSRLR